MKQGSPTCTNARLEGSFGFETTGVFLAAVSAPAVAFIGELKFTVDSSREGVISGHVAASKHGNFHGFEEVTGSYSVDANCRGTATITPKGKSALNFSFLVVDRGNEMLVVETDADTVVSGTLQRSRPAVSDGFQSGPNDDSGT